MDVKPSESKMVADLKIF